VNSADGGVPTRSGSSPLVAEFLGSLLLSAVVIGSGIAAQRLSPTDVGLRLLENAAATALGLYALILVFGPVSGAHFNPVVSLVDTLFGGLSWRRLALYVPTQIAGCVAGAVVANVLFDTAPISISTTERATWPHGVSEVVATVGLLLVIFSLTRSGRAQHAPAAVGAYIGAAYWFTSSTSFANPAITIGRVFSDSFAGIAPASVPPYLLAQLVAVTVAVPLLHVLYPTRQVRPRPTALASPAHPPAEE
jgi:arsenate reductase (thioredoxin)